MPHLAIYDMDKTITRGPSWTRFLVHAARRRAPWRLALLPVAGVAAVGYGLKLIDRGGLKTLTQRLMIGRAVPAPAMRALAQTFADDMLAERVFHGARAHIARDRAEGRRLVLATASHRFYAAAIAERLGFDDVVATDAGRDAEGHILSRLEGENCYGAAKLRLVERWMARERIDRASAHVRAYSDHVSDVPLLEWADEAFAVNAHGPLRRVARARGWHVVDWD